jgi:hypothetical protein
VALLSLGLSTWAVGCRDQTDGSQRELGRSTPSAAVAANSAAVAQAAVQPAGLPAVRKSPPEPIIKPTKPSATSESLGVRRLVVTHAIENREPLAGTLRTGDQPIVAFLEIANGAASEQSVVVTFERAGESVGHVKLRVPAESRRWRTWGQTRRIREPGEWQAVVRGDDGRELARTTFVVVK